VSNVCLKIAEEIDIVKCRLLQAYIQSTVVQLVSWFATCSWSECTV